MLEVDKGLYNPDEHRLHIVVVVSFFMGANENELDGNIHTLFSRIGAIHDEDDDWNWCYWDREYF